MSLLDRIAEARIADALQRGEFDHLPGAGKPLALDDDSMVAPELRGAYRLLKNAGCVPPELDCRREIARIETLLATLPDRRSAAQRRLIRRLNALRAELEARGRSLHLAGRYAAGVYQRLRGSEDETV